MLCFKFVIGQVCQTRTVARHIYAQLLRRRHDAALVAFVHVQQQFSMIDMRSLNDDAVSDQNVNRRTRKSSGPSAIEQLSHAMYATVKTVIWPTQSPFSWIVHRPFQAKCITFAESVDKSHHFPRTVRACALCAAAYFTIVSSNALLSIIRYTHIRAMRIHCALKHVTAIGRAIVVIVFKRPFRHRSFYQRCETANISSARKKKSAHR